MVPYPAHTADFHYEAELVVAIGGDGAHLTPEQVKAAVFGYAVGLDMTRRDLQAQFKKGGKTLGTWPRALIILPRVVRSFR